MAKIRIKYNKRTGKTTVDGEGFVGGECITQIDQLQNILGMQTISEDQKDELAHIVTTGEVDIPSDY
jgi:hypothetical protein